MYGFLKPMAVLTVALAAAVYFALRAGGASGSPSGPDPPADFDWPLQPPEQVRGFAPPSAPWLPGHRGVDLLGRAGQPVLSAGEGTVSYAAPLAGRGVVAVVHRGGLRTTYEPVAAEVKVGDRVATGQRLGRLEQGHSGCAPRVCLHWGLRFGSTYRNPLLLVGAAGVRLLPLNSTMPRRAGPPCRAGPHRRREPRSRRLPAAGLRCAAAGSGAGRRPGT